jgi:hypothetical protein
MIFNNEKGRKTIERSSEKNPIIIPIMSPLKNENCDEILMYP